jgi:hypothetical protein
MDDAVLVIEVRGPGHHDRAEAAARLIASLAALGEVMVETTLRPRLAADVEALLASGATGVVLGGPASSGVFRSTDAPAGGTPEADADVVVRLVADPGPLSATIHNGADTAAGQAAAGMIGRLGLGPT